LLRGFEVLVAIGSSLPNLAADEVAYCNAYCFCTVRIESRGYK
jgi:hypothetical protein